jgi:acetylornithine deacetylase/succinyl-diaminopimelate desuccinylase-like protein
MLYMPTLNIDGIWSGYTGEGVKTILPHIATAKVDSRLPLGLDPDRALEKIRAHLDANGFADIVIRKLSGYPGAQTSVHSELAQAVISVYNKYSQDLSIQPRIGGSAPFYQFTERLGLPLVPAGLGHGRGAHAPNEIYLVEPAPGVPVAGLAEIEKAYVDLLFALADQ